MSRELVESMMDLSASMVAIGARQLGTVLGETASRQAVGAALRLLQQSAEAAHTTLPGETGLEWRELANKLEAFACFQQASSLAAPVPGAGPLLEAPLRRAAALGTYRSVWTIEGLGHARAESAWEAGLPPGRLLPAGRPGEASTRCAIPLHTGAALSFAGRLLATAQARHPAGLARWIALWEERTEPGSRGIAVEALGLVARNLQPYLVRRLGDMVQGLDPLLAEFFWHGAGRGLYFAPSHAFPWTGSHLRAFEKARREPPDEPGRRNAIAGLAWALALVNLRDPEILAGVLRRHGGWIGPADAFAHGVSSAVLVWYDVVGLDAHLADFLAYRPAAPTLAALWRDLVLGPCEGALEHTHPRLRRGGGPTALFRVQPPGRKGAS